MAIKPPVRFAEVLTSMPVRAAGVQLQFGSATLVFDELPDAAWLATLLINASVPR